MEGRPEEKELRVANELEQRVAERTRELAAASEELKREIAERRRTEEALNVRDLQLRLLVDSIAVPVAIMTTTGEVDVINSAVMDYFGKTLEELKRWSFSDAVHPDDLPLAVAKWTAAFQSGEPYEIESRHRRADGVYRWFHVRGFPIRETDGRIIRWCVLQTDIDDRKQTQEALSVSERNLNLVVNTILALVWSTRTDGSADYLSQNYLDYLGLTLEQAQDWGWTVAVHPGDVNRLTTEWRAILASKMAGEAEGRLRRFDGQYRWFLFRANPLRDASGNIVKWFGVNADIDDRKRAEQALNRSQAFLAKGQQLSLTGSFWWDSETGNFTWSDQLYRIFEFEPGMPLTFELIGSRYHPEEKAVIVGIAEKARSGVASFDYTHRLLMPDGSTKYVHVVAHGAVNKEGRLEYFGAVQDVTQRHAAEEALNRARTELTHMARVTSLGALTASIAHEVNQPLSGIITNAGTCLRMLASEPPNVEGARETARRTIRDGNRAAEVIARLRALFGNKTTTVEAVDLNDATREVIALSWSDLQKDHVIVRTEFDDDLPLVRGDRVQFQQVILNLLRNASDAMSGIDDRPRTLLVRTEPDEGDRVRLAVRDVGRGLDPQAVDRLFESFYTTKSNGMGIGLSVSRSIIESHHGRIWGEPNEGPGATFAFSVPRLFEGETSVRDLDAARTLSGTAS